ncbi:MAG TPA: type II toxin-antitoxin system VapC family toxin [Candidatus Kapabacteria bacterium]|nr:type II toxin-antitoxin system VapC family toxin [Candidatus Kapabacteria bacterium]
MKQKTARFVLDAFPLIVLFMQQEDWEIAKAQLDNVFEAGEICMMSSINLGEVYYSLLRDQGMEVANRAFSYITASQIEIVLPTLDQTIQAAVFKATGGISYADCYAAALALELGVPVLTGDREFETVERLGVKIEWLPKNR